MNFFKSNLSVVDKAILGKALSSGDFDFKVNSTALQEKRVILQNPQDFQAATLDDIVSAIKTSGRKEWDYLIASYILEKVIESFKSASDCDLTTLLRTEFTANSDEGPKRLSLTSLFRILSNAFKIRVEKVKKEATA